MHGGEVSFHHKGPNRHDTAWKMAEMTLSLASGTFCAALLGSFFVCCGHKCRLPGSGKENGKNENKLHICKRRKFGG